MTPRICLAIPTYNNPLTLEKVVQDLASLGLPLIVIDDGSDPKVQLKNIRVIRHEKNMGKGRALQTAFKEALGLGFTHLLTVDADGQHPVAEVRKLIEGVHQNPWQLVIGSRNLSGTEVPTASRFGRKFSNFWVQYETGLKISDSQSGLRAYPLFPLQTMHFFTRKYDFEIEILIRLLWKGIQVTEVPVNVIYNEKTRAGSHFNKLHDNIRISLLNCLLVLTSLFKINKSAGKISVALGVGVLVGCTPFFGLHTFIIFLLALIFPLNVGALWVGTQISIPPIAPFLAYLSIKLGENFAKSLYSQWLIGSVCLGIVLGSVFGVLYFVTARWLKQHQKTQWNGKMRGGRFGNGFLIWVVKHFGVRTAYLCLYFIVPYFYFFAPKATLASLEYWKVVDPELSFWRRQARVLQHYLIFGKVLLDRIASQLPDKALVQTESNGFQNISLPINEGRGVIMLSAHLGAWDIAARHIKHRGLRDPFHTVEHKPAGPVLINEDPSNTLKTIFANATQHAVLDIHRILTTGKPIGMMGDRPTHGRIELVPFFGKLIAIDTTAFRIAATLNVPIVFTFGFRNSDLKYTFFAESPREYTFDKARDKQSQCLEWASEYSKTLENYVRKYPLQWFNFYAFFSKPPLPLQVLA